MRPPKVGQFMKWRDAQPSYQEALREVLRLSVEAEILESQGIEEHPILDAWEASKKRLLEAERELIAQFDERYSRGPR